MKGIELDYIRYAWRRRLEENKTKKGCHKPFFQLDFCGNIT
ncbi:hypothetical protein GCM10023142_03290 [Anaerocolumna aminovalerica]